MSIVSCAPSVPEITCGSGPSFPGAAPVALDAVALKAGTGYILAAFRDTAAEKVLDELWADHSTSSGRALQSSATPMIQNLSVMFAVLRERGYSVCTVRPDSYESIYAMCGLHAVTCLLLRTFGGKRVEPLSQDVLLATDLAALSPLADSLCVHVVKTVSAAGEGIRVSTVDGLSLGGLPTDRAIGAVLPVATDGGRDQYVQIVGHFVVASVPSFEVESHLGEWYKDLPYTHVVPKVREIH